MSEIARQVESPAIRHPLIGAQFLCARFGPAFCLMLQIATSSVEDGENK